MEWGRPWGAPNPSHFPCTIDPNHLTLRLFWVSASYINVFSGVGSAARGRIFQNEPARPAEFLFWWQWRGDRYQARAFVESLRARTEKGKRGIWMVKGRLNFLQTGYVETINIEPKQKRKNGNKKLKMAHLHQRFGWNLEVFFLYFFSSNLASSLCDCFQLKMCRVEGEKQWKPSTKKRLAILVSLKRSQVEILVGDLQTWEEDEPKVSTNKMGL